MAGERRRVRDWWGAAFEETIRVRVSDEVSVSMALVPAWRGQRGTMDVPIALVQRDRTASLHELVHIYATNGNRFLAEGLAVYAHDLLGGIAAFPNFGRNLHELAQVTPLASHVRDAGDPTRWRDVYGRPVEQLERDWRRFLDGGGR